MAYIRSHETSARRRGKPVKRFEVCWREPAMDPLTRLLIPGRSRARQESYSTREAAEARRDELNAARHLGATTGLTEARKLGSQPFGDWATAWLASLQLRVDSGNLKQRTQDDAVRLLRRYVLPKFGARAIGSITAMDVERWLGELVRQPSRQGDKRPLSRGTVTHAWNTFRSAMRYAQVHKVISENPCAAVDVKATKATRGSTTFEHMPLTPAQVAALSARISDDGYPTYGLMVTFLAYTGLRASENCGLEIRDVVFRQAARGSLGGSVQIRRTKERKQGEWRSGTPKSKQSRRSVPLPLWLAERMAAYLAEHPRRDEPTAPLWPSRKNGGNYRPAGQRYTVPYDWSEPLAMGTFWDSIAKPALELIGLPASRPATISADGTAVKAVRGVRLHDLRHTFAVMQLMAGTHHIRVSKLMGHATRALVLDVYGDWIQEDEDAASLLPAPPGSPSTSNVLQLRHEAAS